MATITTFRHPEYPPDRVFTTSQQPSQESISVFIDLALYEGTINPAIVDGTVMRVLPIRVSQTPVMLHGFFKADTTGIDGLALRIGLAEVQTDYSTNDAEDLDPNYFCSINQAGAGLSQIDVTTANGNTNSIHPINLIAKNPGFSTLTIAEGLGFTKDTMINAPRFYDLVIEFTTVGTAVTDNANITLTGLFPQKCPLKASLSQHIVIA